jgi:DNA-binding MarR family transcriptional regulator
MPGVGLFPIANEIYVYTTLMMKHFNEAQETRLHQHGESLTSMQMGVLRMLQYEVLTLSTISQRMGMDPSGIMRIIDALETNGLVVREIDPQDRRRNPIRITTRGAGLLIAVPIVSEEDPIFRAIVALGEEQTAQLRDVLREIVTQFPEGQLVAGLFSREAIEFGPKVVARASPNKE